MRKNLIALLLILAALLGSLGELNGWLLPTLSWPFTVSREIPLLNCAGDEVPYLVVDGRVHWFGWLCMLLMLFAGAYLLVRRETSLRLPPEYAKQVERFKKIKRGYWSLIALGVIMLLRIKKRKVLI